MWLVPTRSDLSRALTGAELSAVESVAVASGESDPLPGTLAAAVQLARGYIAGCPRNRLGPADTVPDALLSVVCAIARWNLLNRFPDVGITTDARRGEYSDALATLRDAAACRLAVEAPPEDPPAPEEMPSQAPAIAPRPLHHQFHQSDGL
jgi:phage gp36-like protein